MTARPMPLARQARLSGSAVVSQRSAVSGWRSAVGVIALGVLLALLAACAPVGAAPQAPAFELTNQHARLTRLEDLRGRPALVTFLYTHCPDTCPLYLANLGLALRLVSQSGGQPPAVVVVSVDPERDTVERLREFAAGWPADWLFLTGRYQQLAPVWEAYGVSVQKQPAPHSSDVHAHAGYSVVHTGKVVLLDADGRLRSELRGNWTAQELAARLAEVSAPGAATARLDLMGAVADFLRRCGDLAATSPGLFLGLLLLGLLPAALLSTLLLRSFFTGRRTL